LRRRFGQKVVGANLGRNLVIAAKVWPWSLKVLEHEKKISLHREISICNSCGNIAGFNPFLLVRVFLLFKLTKYCSNETGSLQNTVINF
jgi:hypothetical protein